MGHQRKKHESLQIRKKLLKESHKPHPVKMQVVSFSFRDLIGNIDQHNIFF